MEPQKSDFNIEVLPGFFGNRVTSAFISGEQENKGLQIRDTREQMQFGETGNIKISILWNSGTKPFISGEQVPLGGHQYLIEIDEMVRFSDDISMNGADLKNKHVQMRLFYWLLWIINEQRHEKICRMSYSNTKDTDQPKFYDSNWLAATSRHSKTGLLVTWLY